jgi:hypothetical protein
MWLQKNDNNNQILFSIQQAIFMKTAKQCRFYLTENIIQDKIKRRPLFWKTVTFGS